MILKFIKLWSLIITALLIDVIFISSTNAEIKVYEGFGEHYMENKEETLDHSKNQAKLLAELDVIEQCSFNVESYSSLHNSKLTRDEIISITAGIMKVKSIQYFLDRYADNLFIVKAKLTAEVDTDKIPELVEREVERRKNKQS